MNKCSCGVKPRVWFERFRQSTLIRSWADTSYDHEERLDAGGKTDDCVSIVAEELDGDWLLRSPVCFVSFASCLNTDSKAKKKSEWLKAE